MKTKKPMATRNPTPSKKPMATRKRAKFDVLLFLGCMFAFLAFVGICSLFGVV